MISSKTNYLNPESILLLFLVPGVDMLRLFIVRIKSNKNPLIGDQNHLQHKLLKNFGNLKAVVIYDLLILVPWLIYLLSRSLLPYLIFIVLLTYFFIIFKSDKNYEKN